MKLNHINLPTANVAQTRRLFEKYFGFHCVLEKGADTFVVLLNEDGMALALSNPDGISAVDYPKTFHIGFMQDNDAKVDAIHRRLKAGGIEVGEPKNAHGAWTFYFAAPGGFTVEVSHQRPDG